MQKSQKGFTLIELVVVIVLLGILGVTALGKFQDLSASANQAAVTGIASEISSSTAINYAQSILGVPAYTVQTGGDIVGGTCAIAELNNVFANDTWPTGYTAALAAGDCTGGPGTTYTCTITAPAPAIQTAIATLICTAL